MIRLSHLCGFRPHRPVGGVAANGTLQVGRCGRCRAEIIRRDGGWWKTVPAGMRIVWREPDGDEMTWPTQVLP